MTTKNGKKNGSGLSLLELCNEALDCERQIKLLKDRQSGLEKEIKAIAKSDKESRVPTDGGGYSLQYQCKDGSFVKVTKYGDTLRASLAAESDELDVAKALAGGAFSNLFKTVVSYALVPDFRKEAERLVPEHAGKLIDTVSKVGKTDVSYHVAKKLEQG